jgi:molybdopterin/thiamine biosynthesis adenylyltransferase
MRVFISSHALSQLKPGMKIHGVIREEENTAHICAPEITQDRSVIGQVLQRGEAIPTPPQSPWLFVFAHSSQPKVFIWSQNHLSLTQVEVIEDHDVFARTPFDPACLKTLQHSTVTIFGCGTGGSYLALELARAGVGNFILIDPDTMEAPNLSRHEGGFSDLGRNKVSVVKNRILDIHPNAKVKCYPRDIFQDDSDTFMYDLFTQSSLVIASTDILAVQLMINEWVVMHQTPAVFGGCYENAIGGEVFAYVSEWETPCLCCLKGGGVVVQQKRGPIDYPKNGSCPGNS